ncbi:hypothetical protein PI124_g14219 [Phytophthora idaei]|nr:hypothetical protein PI124_g14219 [Phytophthora idaei]
MSSSVPPIETVLKAIHEASTATHLLDLDKCPGGSVLVFPFEGDDYVLCSRRPSTSWFHDNGFRIFGSDLIIDVRYEQSAPRIAAPSVASDVVASCGTVPFGKLIIPSVSSLLARSVSEWGRRSLRTEEAEFSFADVIQKKTGDGSGYSCKSKRRVYVFIVGLRSYKHYGLTEDDPTNYFGKRIADRAVETGSA